MMLKINLEVIRKVVPLHSHLKNGWPLRLKVLYKTDAWGSALKVFWKIFLEKLADLKIMRTFAAPFEKRVTRKSGYDKFIEKTDLLYKKQVPRNTIYREALISLWNYKCQDKLRDIKNIQWRVWSWLRMNASGRLNTCKSRGSMKVSNNLWWRPAQGCVTREQLARFWGITVGNDD